MSGLAFTVETSCVGTATAASAAFVAISSAEGIIRMGTIAIAPCSHEAVRFYAPAELQAEANGRPARTSDRLDRRAEMESRRGLTRRLPCVGGRVGGLGVRPPR